MKWFRKDKMYDGPRGDFQWAERSTPDGLTHFSGYGSLGFGADGRFFGPVAPTSEQLREALRGSPNKDPMFR